QIPRQHSEFRKLRQLDAAATLEDLRNPPGNRLEAVKCKFFGLSEGYFLRLQNAYRVEDSTSSYVLMTFKPLRAYDMREAKRRIAAQLTKIQPYKPGKAA